VAHNTSKGNNGRAPHQMQLKEKGYHSPEDDEKQLLGLFQSIDLSLHTCVLNSDGKGAQRY
jgi:hypothetical protein